MNASIDWTSLLLLLGSAVVLPWLVALVTRQSDSAPWKAGVLAVLAAIGSALTELINQGVDGFDVNRFLTSLIIAWAAATLAYKGRFPLTYTPAVKIAAATDYGKAA